MLLEKHLAKEFTEMFREFQLWVPNNRTGGWPDRGVQINNSRIIWFELKIIPQRYGATTFRVNELSAEQSAWLAKWQRSGGFCYLMLGFVDYLDEHIVNYGILRCGSWDLWLKVRQHPVRYQQLLVYSKDKYDIYKWFKDEFRVAGKVNIRLDNE